LLGSILSIICLIYIVFIIVILLLGLCEKLWKYCAKIIANKKYYNRWIKESEVKHRYTKGYPEDWTYRKYIIINNNKLKCASCGNKIIRGDKHIHHILPISKGGDHSLSNLELLCEECHIAKHPRYGNLLRKNKLIKQLSDKARFVKSSTRLWKCNYCGETIQPKDSYYGDINIKFCKNCFSEGIKKIIKNRN
jgi:5-methylcytosine-specific restriction endonuclease McrA